MRSNLAMNEPLGRRFSYPKANNCFLRIMYEFARCNVHAASVPAGFGPDGIRVNVEIFLRALNGRNSMAVPIA